MKRNIPVKLRYFCSIYNDTCDIVFFVSRKYAHFFDYVTNRFALTGVSLTLSHREQADLTSPLAFPEHQLHLKYRETTKGCFA